MIPLAVPDLRGREREYLQRCIDDNWVSSVGPFVTQFETAIARAADRKHAVATVNGTTAIQLALLVAGVRPGDRVVVPDWTFAASANAICHAGAIPYFLDVDTATWTLDPVQVAEALQRPPQRIGAVLAVDTLGHMADYHALAPICAKASVPLIEDAAGAFGARGFGRPAGAFGQAAIFSFNGNKIVTAGGGGMIVTDDDRIAAECRNLSTQARAGEEYNYRAVGFNFRMTNLNAAVGLAQFERLDDILACRRAIWARYDAAFASRNDMELMPHTPWAETNCWLYAIRLRSEAAAASLVAHLRLQQIEARAFWRSLSRQSPYSDFPHLRTDVSKSLSGALVTLPSGSQLTPAEQDKVLAAVAAWTSE